MVVTQQPAKNNASSTLHCTSQLITLFDETFFDSENTRLIKGADEPLYLPKSLDCSYHQIIFARGYFSSALHEIAHWCIASKARRQLEDFGYWYKPDGRSETEQQAFEQVEIKPQAIEWAFCVAANKKFFVSADNLNGAEADTAAFKKKVYQQVQYYLSYGFPPRAQVFIDALARFYQQALPLSLADFYLDQELYRDV